MTNGFDGHVWRLRPGLLTERGIRWGLFLLGITLGAMGFLWQTGGGPRVGMAVVYWPIPTLVISLVLAFPVARRLINALQGRGCFGRVRLEGGRLEAKGMSFDLARPIRMDGRRQSATIAQYYSSPFRSGSGIHRTRRGRDLYVFAMCVQLSQDGRTVTLYGDLTNEADHPDVEGLRLRDLGFAPLRGARVRLAPMDLAELLRALYARATETPNQAMTSDAPPPAKFWGEDPRLLFAPRTRQIAGVLVILALLAVGPVLYARHLGQGAGQQRATLRAQLAKEHRETVERMAPMVGRWVRVEGLFKKGIHGFGWVTATDVPDLAPSTNREFWRPAYKVLLDRVCETATGRVIPPDETVWCNGIYVKKGDTISVPRKYAIAETPPEGVSPPPGIKPTTAPTPNG